MANLFLSSLGPNSFDNDAVYVYIGLITILLFIAYAGKIFHFLKAKISDLGASLYVKIKGMMHL